MNQQTTTKTDLNELRARVRQVMNRVDYITIDRNMSNETLAMLIIDVFGETCAYNIVELMLAELARRRKIEPCYV